MALEIRVARWCFYNPKIPKLESLEMENIGIFYG
jgi:hypothetical protein